MVESPYYIDRDRQEGLLCFECASTKCSKCSKTILLPATYFEKLFPQVDRNDVLKSNEIYYRAKPRFESLQEKKLLLSNSQ